MSRRNKKLRRRIRMTLKGGHEARHKLIAGRTGSVHSKKTRVMAKADGILETIVVEPRFKRPEEIIAKPMTKPKIVHIPRQKIAPQEEPIESTEILVEEPETQVPAIEEAYGLCLAAQQTLIALGLPYDHPGQQLLNGLAKGIEDFEKRRLK